MLETLISSKTRIKLLIKFFLHGGTKAYLRRLEAEFGDSTNAIRLELNRLEGAGLLVSNQEGNRKVYTANTAHPLCGDLQSLLCKYVGLDQVQQVLVAGVQGMRALYLGGQYAQGLESTQLDLILIGAINSQSIAPCITQLEHSLNKSVHLELINPVQTAEEELVQRVADCKLLWSSPDKEAGSG